MKADVTAYAKINLLLDVHYKRPDGFHEVTMIMQAVDLSDHISITASETNQLYCENQYIPNDMSNLAMRGVVAMQKHFPQVPPLTITLEKHIPVAAGLAGGSSDCAAVMLGINQLFGLNADEQTLANIAAEIGSDIPFCLTGPTALATGRGEIIEPLPELPAMWVVLVKPAFGVSTAEVYGHLEQFVSKSAFDLLIMGTLDCDRLLNRMRNSLESSTFKRYPYVRQLKQELEEMGGRHTLMSGSGPTVFSVFDNEQRAVAFYEQAKQRYEQVYLTKTVSRQQIKERVTIDGE